MANRFLWIVDGENIDNQSLEMWPESGLETKLNHFDPNWIVWDPDGKWRDACDRVYGNTEQLFSAIQEKPIDAVIIVEAGQLFLDDAIVQEGLRSWNADGTDYFTQWEHCRIPVGIGIRGISRRALEKLGAESPKKWIDKIHRDAGNFRFHYESIKHCSFEESLLDARDQNSLREVLSVLPTPPSWDLAGFLALASLSIDPPVYSAPPTSTRIDERGMPAAYGFESEACADFPTYVMFDIINICNARCIHCPQSMVANNGKQPEFLVEKGQLSFDAFCRAIDECAEHEIDFIRITADGEPLVHRRLFDMIEYATAKGVGPIGLTTNGSLLTRDRSLRLIDSGVSLVDFSLDAATKETFEKVRAGLRFEKTQHNVHEFLDLCEKQNAPIKVIVSFVKQAENEHEVDAFREYWGAKGR